MISFLLRILLFYGLRYEAVFTATQYMTNKSCPIICNEFTMENVQDFWNYSSIFPRRLVQFHVVSMLCKLDKTSLTYTVCPGSIYPPEIFFYIFASENEVYTCLHHLLTITILQGEYYSFTEQNNFRPDELHWIKQFDSIFKVG